MTGPETETETETETECETRAGARDTHTGRLPPGDFEPTPETLEAIRERRPDVDVAGELDRFRFHEQSRSRSDWQAAFVKFCMHAHARGPDGDVWAEVRALARNSGGASARAGPRLNAAVSQLGGWHRLGRMSERDLESLKPAILKAYADVAHG